MSVPKPPVPLKNHCSVIHDNQLYTYQVDAFQVLDLKEGGKWSQLPLGVPTTGSTCVLGTWDDQAALIIVGGTTDKDNYHGFQYYSFKDDSWISVKPAEAVAKDRLRHGAVFLQQTSQILTYGGYRGVQGYTSDTFLISTKAPYGTQAFGSWAPPALDPTVLQYNTSHALVAGGTPTNTKLFLFNPQSRWTQLPETLNAPLADITKMKAVVQTSSDGSKTMEIFDMTTQPASMSTVSLQNGTTPNQKRSIYAVSPHHPFKRRRRDMGDRPGYNATFAPKAGMEEFSLAQDLQKGLLVMSGGNDQSPLAIFDNSKNGWVDPNTFFNGDTANTAAASSSQATPSATPTPTANPTASLTPASSSAVAASQKKSSDSSLSIIGGTLGGLLGAGLMLAIIILLIKLQKKKRDRQKAEEEYRKSKTDMDFMDQGADFMREVGGFAASSHHEKERKRSHLSPGKGGHSRVDSSQSKKALLHRKNDSAGSQKSFYSQRSKSPAPQISGPIHSGPSFTKSITNSPTVRGEENTWSTYFADNNHIHEAMQRPPSTLSDPRASQISSNRASSSALHSSAEIDPIHLRQQQQQHPRYPSANLGVALTHGVSRPSLQSRNSPTPSIVSDIQEESYHSTPHHKPTWSPVASASEADDHHNHLSNQNTRDSNLTASSHHLSSSTADTTSYPYPIPLPAPSHQTREKPQLIIPDFPMPSSGRSSLAGTPISPSAGGVDQPPLPTRSPKRLASADSASGLGLGLRNVVSRDLLLSNSSKNSPTSPHMGPGRQTATSAPQTGMQRVNPAAQPLVPKPALSPQYHHPSANNSFLSYPPPPPEPVNQSFFPQAKTPSLRSANYDFQRWLGSAGDGGNPQGWGSEGSASVYSKENTPPQPQPGQAIQGWGSRAGSVHYGGSGWGSVGSAGMENEREREGKNVREKERERDREEKVKSVDSGDMSWLNLGSSVEKNDNKTGLARAGSGLGMFRPR